ncbi:MAG: hypothetical protein ACXWLM_04370 [Myxococcales bacterium]
MQLSRKTRAGRAASLLHEAQIERRWMERVLEEIVAADEELQARLAAAAREAKDRVAAARAAAEKRERERLERAEARLSEELRALAATTDRELEQRRRRRAEWIVARSASAEALLPAAAETWARIVRDGE